MQAADLAACTASRQESYLDRSSFLTSSAIRILCGMDECVLILALNQTELSFDILIAAKNYEHSVFSNGCEKNI